MAAPGVAAQLIGVLRERGQTLATAESLTGGGVGAELTSVPGASDVYVGGLIAYATELKRTHLGVSDTTIRDHGVVSAECALEMARGAVDRTRADWGLSTTGVAGPDTQEGKPAGTAFVGIIGPAGALVERLELPGDREAVRAGVVDAALGRLLAMVRDEAV